MINSRNLIYTNILDLTGIRLSNTAFIIFKSPTGLFNRKLYLKNL